MDPLDALIAELERIEGQQVTIKDAVQNSKPIVVHPRKEVSNMQQPRLYLLKLEFVMRPPGTSI